MILIKIGSEERQFTSGEEHWISEQLNRRRTDGVNPCIRITVRQGDLNLTLATAGCVSSGGASRRPTPQEAAIFDLWQERGLNDPNFNQGNLVSFLNQIKRSL